MKTYILPILFLLSIILACSPAPKDSSDLAEDKENISLENTLLSPLLDAHGSLSTWQSFKSLSFTMESKRGNNSSAESFIINLENRHEKISGENFVMGWDGENYWQLLQDTSVSKKNVKFLINLQFYFFAMPFVFADPGVKYEDLGKQTISGKTYNGIKITYEDGTGVAPKDQYLVYSNPETQQMELLLYSVTYFDESRAERYSALAYSEWQDIQGLKVPKRLTRYAWDAEKKALGETRGEKIFSEVKFQTSEPSTAIFKVPEGALTEQKE